MADVCNYTNIDVICTPRRQGLLSRNTSTFKSFFSDQKCQLSLKYPFLSEGQIKHKIASRWGQLSAAERQTYKPCARVMTPGRPRMWTKLSLWKTHASQQSSTLSETQQKQDVPIEQRDDGDLWQFQDDPSSIATPVKFGKNTYASRQHWSAFALKPPEVVEGEAVLCSQPGILVRSNDKRKKQKCRVSFGGIQDSSPKCPADSDTTHTAAATVNGSRGQRYPASPSEPAKDTFKLDGGRSSLYHVYDFPDDDKDLHNTKDSPAYKSISPGKLPFKRKKASKEHKKPATPRVKAQKPRVVTRDKVTTKKCLSLNLSLKNEKLNPSFELDSDEERDYQLSQLHGNDLINSLSRKRDKSSLHFNQHQLKENEDVDNSDQDLGSFTEGYSTPNNGFRTPQNEKEVVWQAMQKAKSTPKKRESSESETMLIPEEVLDAAKMKLTEMLSPKRRPKQSPKEVPCSRPVTRSRLQENKPTDSKCNGSAKQKTITSSDRITRSRSWISNDADCRKRKSSFDDNTLPTSVLSHLQQLPKSPRSAKKEKDPVGKENCWRTTSTDSKPAAVQRSGGNVSGLQAPRRSDRLSSEKSRLALLEMTGKEQICDDSSTLLYTKVLEHDIDKVSIVTPEYLIFTNGNSKKQNLNGNDMDSNENEVPECSSPTENTAQEEKKLNHFMADPKCCEPKDTATPQTKSSMELCNQSEDRRDVESPAFTLRRVDQKGVFVEEGFVFPPPTKTYGGRRRLHDHISEGMKGFTGTSPWIISPKTNIGCGPHAEQSTGTRRLTRSCQGSEPITRSFGKESHRTRHRYTRKPSPTKAARHNHDNSMVTAVNCPSYADNKLLSSHMFETPSCETCLGTMKKHSKDREMRQKPDCMQKHEARDQGIKTLESVSRLNRKEMPQPEDSIMATNCTGATVCAEGLEDQSLSNQLKKQKKHWRHYHRDKHIKDSCLAKANEDDPDQSIKIKANSADMISSPGTIRQITAVHHSIAFAQRPPVKTEHDNNMNNSCLDDNDAPADVVTNKSQSGGLDLFTVKDVNSAMHTFHCKIAGSQVLLEAMENIRKAAFSPPLSDLMLQSPDGDSDRLSSPSMSRVSELSNVTSPSSQEVKEPCNGTTNPVAEKPVVTKSQTYLHEARQFPSQKEEDGTSLPDPQQDNIQVQTVPDGLNEQGGIRVQHAKHNAQAVPGNTDMPAGTGISGTVPDVSFDTAPHRSREPHGTRAVEPVSNKTNVPGTRAVEPVSNITNVPGRHAVEPVSNITNVPCGTRSVQKVPHIINLASGTHDTQFKRDPIKITVPQDKRVETGVQMAHSPDKLYCENIAPEKSGEENKENNIVCIQTETQSSSANKGKTNNQPAQKSTRDKYNEMADDVELKVHRSVAEKQHDGYGSQNDGHLVQQSTKHQQEVTFDLPEDTPTEDDIWASQVVPQPESEVTDGNMLCNMFQDMTPPVCNQSVTKRRVVASNQTQTSSNFANLFQQDTIFL